jgi:hypothetical protein
MVAYKNVELGFENSSCVVVSESRELEFSNHQLRKFLHDITNF